MNFIPSINFLRSDGKRPKSQSLRGLAMLALFGITFGIPCARQAFGGILEIRVKDHREAIGDFSNLELLIDTVRLKPTSGLKFWKVGWKELKPSQKGVDLTKYTGNNSAMIFRGEVSPGLFEGIDIKLKGIEGTLKKTGKKAPVKNLVGPVQLAFSIRAREKTLLVLDFVVLDISDHPQRGYELYIKGYEIYTNGTLVDKVPPA
ncbi:MAG: DUF4382 domain-containing protein [Candidatus Binatia bacterium]